MAAIEESNDGAVGGEHSEANLDLPVSPKTKAPSIAQAIESLGSSNSALESISMRADPDAQATVTDYLDFTEYLPSDMMRSLTLIGQLDQTYIDASTDVDKLTMQWGKLPTVPADQRPAPVQLRGEISENLNRAVSSRVYSHAEALRMAENVTRHYNRAKTILSKLQIMLENYPTAEEMKSPVQTKSPQLSRAPKITLRLDNAGQKVRRAPRITVPGEVLAPYEVDLNVYSSSSDESSDDDISASPSRRAATPGTHSRIRMPKQLKLPKQKLPKPPRPPRSGSGNAVPMLSTSTALAQLKPPPENAVIGSSDAPWLQLTPYELARLRKRMKKNAVWNPSDTMIARELSNLGRGVEAYRAAMKQAEEEGKPFDPALPAPIVDAESGAQHPPEGAISADALGAEEVQLSNRGMKLNEAKKLKREALARIAAEEAEESARKMAEAARMMFNNGNGGSPGGESSPDKGDSKGSAKSKNKKRKRSSDPEPTTEKLETSETLSASAAQKPQKRNKLETPILPPSINARPASMPPTAETPIRPPPVAHTPAPSVSGTPVPVPTSEASIAVLSAASPSSATSPVPASAVTTTVVPTKPPAAETPVPPPILPPSRELNKRETRNDHKKSQPPPPNIKQSSSRPNTPITSIPAPESPSLTARRPVSRGKAASQEPPASLATDRPRRASTARNTPAPEARQQAKRPKRPAPGIVTVTSNEGSTSAVGKRKAAPRKKVRGPKRDKNTNQQSEQEVEVEVDDDGNVIDPDEPRYCLCNGVSFGTMIQCDNVDVSTKTTTVYPFTAAVAAASAAQASSGHTPRNKRLTAPPIQNCKQEWFHLECVGLSEIPARTTKWYCPDCRIALNIGGRGEVTSRGVRS